MPVGALAIVLLVVIWCIAIASLSATVGGWHWLAQLAFYLIAGIAWIAPARAAACAGWNWGAGGETHRQVTPRASIMAGPSRLRLTGPDGCFAAIAQGARWRE